jgi:hypothetical protein
MDTIVDKRDQDFVLYELLKIQELFESEKFKEYDQEMCDMAINLAKDISEEHVLGCYSEVDKDGAKWDNGEVTVPEPYKKLHKIMNDSGLFTMGISQESGGPY